MIEKTIYATLEFIDVELLLNSSTVHSTEDAELYFGTFYKGDPGDKGDTGAKVVSTELIGQDAQGGNVYRQTFDDSSTSEFTAPKGAKGGDGEPGPPGPPGTTDYNELKNKPTKLSDFENDEGFITSEYHDATKQDTITDLATIRSGAAAGATAVQPSAISDMETRTHAANSYVAKESGKGLSSNDYTTTEKNKLAGIEAGAQKNPTAVSQLENDAQYLKLQEVKPNGNIVLTDGTNSREYMAATPSGDPMHYAYVAAGAEYNATGADIVKTDEYGEQITHKAGYWYLNGLGDLTNSDLSKMYLNVLNTASDTANYGRGFLDRTNFQVGYNLMNVRSSVYTFYNSKLETIHYNGYLSTVNTYFMCLCTNLTKIYGEITVLQGNIPAQFFNNNTKLRLFKILNLKMNINFSTCKAIEVYSIFYLVDNAANTTAITITLHADAYARCMADTTEYTYQGQTYTGIIAYAAARQISIVSA